MPRKSAAALSVLPRVDGRPTPLRPRSGMPDEVHQIFLELVATERPEHFRQGDADLVEQLAVSVLWARRAHLNLEADGGLVDGRPSPWLVHLEKHGRAIVALSGRLRLCPQSRLDRKSAGRRPETGMSFYDLERLSRSTADAGADDDI